MGGLAVYDTGLFYYYSLCAIDVSILRGFVLLFYPS